MFNRLPSIRKEIFENCRILKNINFSYDIDKKLSDEYRINSEKGYLEFLYHQIEAIRPEEYTAIVGELVTSGKKVCARAIVDKRIDNDGYHSHILLNRSIIIEQADIIQIEFCYEKDSQVQLRFNNSYENELLNDFASNKIALDSDSFNNKSRNSIIAMIKDDNSFFFHREGNHFNTLFSINCEFDRKIEFTLDLRQGIALINSKKVSIREYNNLNIDINFVTVTCDSHKQDTKLVINNTMFGRSRGYIYIKPFSIESKQYNVVLVSKGNPEMQYYDYNKTEWCKLGNNRIIQDVIALRVNMQSWERIYNILVIES